MPWLSNDTFETDAWHYIKAKHDSGARSGGPRLLVVHAAQTGEGKNTAVSIGNWFASGKTKGSTHAGVDGSEVGDGSPHTCQYVKDALIAHGAPGANHDGMHCEIAGMSEQSRAQWDDAYSQRAIARCADVFAQWSLKYDIPLIALSNDELRAGKAGIVTHHQVSQVYKRSDHWDPGPNFPMDDLLSMSWARQRFHLSTHPGFQPEAGEPDFRVAVVAEGEVDQGMARVYGHFNELKYLTWPHTSVSVGTAVLVGAAAKRAKSYRKNKTKVHILSGANRHETAALVAAELARGKRSADLDY